MSTNAGFELKMATILDDDDTRNLLLSYHSAYMPPYSPPSKVFFYVSLEQFITFATILDNQRYHSANNPSGC